MSALIKCVSGVPANWNGLRAWCTGCKLALNGWSPNRLKMGACKRHKCACFLNSTPVTWGDYLPPHGNSAGSFNHRVDLWYPSQCGRRKCYLLLHKYWTLFLSLECSLFSALLVFSNQVTYLNTNISVTLDRRIPAFQEVQKHSHTCSRKHWVRNTILASGHIFIL